MPFCIIWKYVAVLTFQTVYDELELMINDITKSPVVDEKQKVNYYAVLFIIMYVGKPTEIQVPALTRTRHRSATVNPHLRETRLESFLRPIKQSWDNTELSSTLSTFQGFTTLLGIERVQKYLIDRRVFEIEDWSTVALDDEGKALQTEMNAKFLASSLVPVDVGHELTLPSNCP